MIAILSQILAVPLVIGLFRLAPRWAASLSASFVFLCVCTISVIYFYKAQKMRSVALWAWVVFLYAFVIPIFMMRLSAGFYYEGSIADLYPRLSLLHTLANPAYLLAFAISLWEVYRMRRAH